MKNNKLIKIILLIIIIVIVLAILVLFGIKFLNNPNQVENAEKSVNQTVSNTTEEDKIYGPRWKILLR